MPEHESFQPQDHPADDLVDRAAAALRGSSVPDGPSAELLADTLSAIRERQASIPPSAHLRLSSSDDDDGNTSFSRRFLTMKTLRRFAVAAVVALALGAVVWTTAPFAGKPAFADVLQKVQKVQSVRFKTHMKMLMPGQTKPTDADVTSLIVGNRMRQDIHGAGVQIMDFKSGEVVMLMPKDKQAIRMRLDNMPKEVKDRNILQHFHTMSSDSGKLIGHKEIDGRKLDAYAVEENGQKSTVYADPETKLPVRMEVKLEMPMIPNAEIVMTDFEWDVAADESAIGMSIPSDYQTQNLNFDASKPTEKDLVESFRTLLKMSGGKYPDSTDMAGFVSVLKDFKDFKDLKAGIGNDQAKKSAEFMQTLMTAFRGFTFVRPANGDDFRYAGKGASLNDHDRPVFWYRPAKSDTYHVIYADLTIQTDVPSGALPQIASQEVKAFSFTKPPATDPAKEVK